MLAFDAMQNFDSAWYLDRYPDVKFFKSGPLAHYNEYGKAEGRHPNKYMEQVYLICKELDTDWYISHYEDVRSGDIDPSIHYAVFGKAEARHPNKHAFLRAKSLPGNFDAQWYLARYKDVAASNMTAADHYIYFGKNEGRATSLQSEKILREHRLEPFIRTLYSSGLGRSASQSEIDHWVNRLLNGVDSINIVREILGSSEAKDFISKWKDIKNIIDRPRG